MIYIFNHWWNRNNYGAVLTAYSIQQLLLAYNQKSFLINDIREDMYNARDRKYTALFPFKNNHMKFINGLRSHTDFVKLNENSNTFVVGSDQVFRGVFLNQPRINEYMLNFANLESKKIAFSASYAFDKEEYLKETTPEFIEKFKTYVASFDFISVREKDGVEICKDLFGVDAEWIIDPVFVLEKEKWEELIEGITPHPSPLPQGARELSSYKNKIVSYVLDTSEEYDRAYKYLEEKYNKKLVKTANSNISIENWLASIRDCDLFVTDSFHGMCFAIIFNKPFICLANKDRGASRFESICEMLGIKFQCIESILEVMERDCVFQIDYNQVNEKIAYERQRGLDFLKKALDAPIKVTQEKINARMRYLEEQILELDKRDNLKYQLKKIIWDNWIMIYTYYLPKPVKIIISFFWKILKGVINACRK